MPLGKSLWRVTDRCASGAVVALSLLAGSVGATTIGGLPGAYLRSPVGADAYARGGAQSADPEYLCSWWNPAALAALKQKKLALGGAVRSFGRTDGLFGWEFRIPPRAALGLALLYRGDGALDNLRDADENPLEEGAYTSLTGKVGVAYMVTRKVSLGINVGVHYQRLPTSYDTRSGELEYSSATGIGGIDVGMRLVPANGWVMGFLVKNLNAGMDWEIAGPADLNAHIEDRFPSTFVLASEHEGTFLGKPLIWSCDLLAYVLGHGVDGGVEKLEHPEVVINNGFEWRRWDVFWIRAGLRGFGISGDLTEGGYLSRNGFSVTSGFGLDLSKQVEGLSVNWAFATDKVWGGVETQLDVVFSF